MPVTFLSAQNRLNNDYFNRTDLTAETKTALIRAIRHFERERFWFNQTATALAVSTASSGLALPADFIALDFVTVRQTSGGVTSDSVVTPRVFDRIAFRNRSTVKGPVEEVGFYKNQLQFAPIADSAYTVTVYYTHSLPTLSADGDTNDWLSAAEDLIVYHAAADVMLNILHRDPAEVQPMKALETEAYATLKHGRDIRMLVNEDLGVQGAVQRVISPRANGPDMAPQKP